MTTGLKAWGRILRLPNLFTVPGDVIAGFALAGGVIAGGASYRALFSLCAASLLAYITGLLTNDLADMKADARERPERPLPSGAISVRAVVTVAAAAGILTLLFSCINIFSVLNGTALLLCIFAYNFFLKDKRFWGPFAMGLCRFLNVTLGATLPLGYQTVSWIAFIPALIFATGMLLYIYGVTAAAAGETQTLLKRPGRRMFLAGAGVMYLLILGIMTGAPTDFRHIINGLVAALTGGVFLSLAYFTARMFTLPLPPRETQRSIGLLIRDLILIQSAATACRGEITSALVLTAFYAAAFFASKKIYGS